MFKLITKKEKPILDEEIERVIKLMSTVNPNSDEYTAMTKNLDTLTKAKGSVAATRRRVSPDVIVSGVFSLVSIGCILGYEQLHVITSKAIGFIPRGRV